MVTVSEEEGDTSLRASELVLLDNILETTLFGEFIGVEESANFSVVVTQGLDDDLKTAFWGEVGWELPGASVIVFSDCSLIELLFEVEYLIPNLTKRIKKHQNFQILQN